MCGREISNVFIFLTFLLDSWFLFNIAVKFTVWNASFKVCPKSFFWGHLLIKHTLLEDTCMHKIAIVFQSPIVLNMINLKSPVIKGINYCYILLHTLNTFALNKHRSDPLFKRYENFMNNYLSLNVWVSKIDIVIQLSGNCRRPVRKNPSSQGTAQAEIPLVLWMTCALSSDQKNVCKIMQECRRERRATSLSVFPKPLCSLMGLNSKSLLLSHEVHERKRRLKTFTVQLL